MSWLFLVCLMVLETELRLLNSEEIWIRGLPLHLSTSRIALPSGLKVRLSCFSTKIFYFYGKYMMGEDWMRVTVKLSFLLFKHKLYSSAADITFFGSFRSISFGADSFVKLYRFSPTLKFISMDSAIFEFPEYDTKNLSPCDSTIPLTHFSFPFSK